MTPLDRNVPVQDINSPCPSSDQASVSGTNLEFSNYFLAAAVIPRIMFIIATVFFGLGLLAGILAWNIDNIRYAGIFSCVNGWMELLGGKQKIEYEVG